MKEYKLNENEHNYLISIVANTKRKYFTKEFRRNEIAKFESLDNFQELETYSEMDQIENKFYMDELLRIAKPYLTRREMNTLKKAIDNNCFVNGNFDEDLKQDICFNIFITLSKNRKKS